MSAVINVQPNAGTRVRFVQNEVEAPTLVIYDGTATVFFCPAPIVGALLDTQRFAEALTEAAAAWARACGRAVGAGEVVNG